MSFFKSILGKGAKGLTSFAGGLMGRESAGVASAYTAGTSLLGADAMNWMRGANPYARNAIGGAALGGMYGAVSDDTSILGGMAMGAGAGAAFTAGRRGYKAFAGARANGVGFGRSMRASASKLYGDLSALGKASKRHIGSGINKAVMEVDSTLKV